MPAKKDQTSKPPAKSGSVIVKYMHEIADADGDNPIPHKASMTIADPADKRPALVIEYGATLLDASDWQHYLDTSDELARLMEIGAVEVIGHSVLEVSQMGVGSLTRLVNASRHGSLLRQLLEIEEKAERPRVSVRNALRKRVRIYGDYSPPLIKAMGAR